MRLQKILSAVASRRKAEEYIAAGRVTINGKTAQIGAQADPARDEIMLDGKKILAPAQHVYIMLHKPKGVITSAHDPQGRKTVLDFFKGDEGVHPFRIFPVGRLDFDTSGLLLLTNDGDFAQRLTHPSNKIKKTYIARVRGTPDANALAALREGIDIEGRRTAPCEVELMKKGALTQLRITLHEGRNRQVRKMCDATGHPAISLKRIAVGVLRLGDLPSGAWRHLTAQEINQLS